MATSGTIDTTGVPFKRFQIPPPPEGGCKARPGPDFRQVRRQDHLLPADAADIRQNR